MANKQIKTIRWPLNPDDIISMDFLFHIWIAIIKVYENNHPAVTFSWWDISNNAFETCWGKMAAIFSYKSYDLKFIILRHGPSYPPSLIAFVLVGLELICSILLQELWELEARAYSLANIMSYNVCVYEEHWLVKATNDPYSGTQHWMSGDLYLSFVRVDGFAREFFTWRVGLVGAAGLCLWERSCGGSGYHFV